MKCKSLAIIIELLIYNVLALSQLNKLPSFLIRRREIASIYIDYFKDHPFISPAQPCGETQRNAHHLFVVRIKYDELNITRAQFMETMRSKGIGTQVHYIPVSLHPYYKRKSSSFWILPNAYNYYDEALSIPCFYSLSIDQQMFVCETIKGYARRSHNRYINLSHSGSMVCLHEFA